MLSKLVVEKSKWQIAKHIKNYARNYIKLSYEKVLIFFKINFEKFVFIKLRRKPSRKEIFIFIIVTSYLMKIIKYESFHSLFNHRRDCDKE